MNVALKTKLAVNTDCILKPDAKAKDKKINPMPNNLNTTLYPFSIGKFSVLIISPF